MKVLFAAAEGAPLYKVGGLGDVAYALPQALHRLGVDIRVVLPYYSRLIPDDYRAQTKDVAHFTLQFGQRNVYVGIKTLMLGEVPVYLIDNEEFFGRDYLYGSWDDGGRFGFFQMALIEMLQVIDWIPDVIHVNDWHTAMVPVLLKDKYQWIAPYQQIKTQLTIHNLQFQGEFPPSVLDDVFGIGRQYFNDDGFAQNGAVNYMKGGINFADIVSTVSPSYAQEIQTPAMGERLDGTLRKNAGKLAGILNGIDTTLYNPATDQTIASTYDAVDLTGKARDKAALQNRMQLPISDDPVFGMVTRLTRQKGVDLLLNQLENFLLHQPVQVVILGTGDADLEGELLALADRFAGQLAVQLRFDEQLARQIYAGADFFMMPSAFEPSGLAQMMAMRYGTIPIVHETGGLRDSVQPFDPNTGSGTGLSFYDYRPEVLGTMLAMGADLYVNHFADYQQLQQQAMQADFSWDKASAAYLAHYQSLMR
ncbi:glycogen synthase GlgA [Lacticaseibacillus saniviri]